MDFVSSWRVVTTRVVLVVGLGCAASPAFAHSAEGLSGGFLAGFSHPLRGMDHLLAMVAVGLWGAFLGRPLIGLLPIIFPGFMVAGAMLAILNFPQPPVELGIAISVIALGGAIAAAWRAPVCLAVTLTGAFGLFHGYAHGAEIPSLADPGAYSAGFVFATGLLHVSGIALGGIVRWRGGKVAIRGAGALVCAAGLYFLVEVFR